ncbi:uncharacterized protein LOC120179370 [Hibiscus syriacus]|uniref:uncharacterized protein LOC120179370 n=1 Tax=Hibiscus syriacus TaxID=106335 RepID=UPI0019217BFC|nr:uncharacterized protein LOC120179370 [Hibiscus syriacus]
MLLVIKTCLFCCLCVAGQWIGPDRGAGNLADDDHRIDRTSEVAQKVWAEVFFYLAGNNVMFEGILLKPSMVTPGAECKDKATPQQVADYTPQLLHRIIPQTVLGIMTVENDLGSSSWVIEGDFNITASPEESSDFEVIGVHYTPDMREFQECLDDLELMDHPFLGPLFTWLNRQEDSFLARLLLGHCEGNPMQCLFQKLKRLKSCLKDFNKEFFSDISGRVKSKKSDLEHIQLFNLSHVGQRRMDDERIIQAELVDLEIVESEFYRQRAKMHWLKEGDLNTRFFHQMVESNKKDNTIRVIMSEEGQYFESFDEMAVELVSFFTDLIGSADPMVSGCSIEILKDMLTYTLPNDAADSLTKEVDDLEIKKALFKQGKDKSPGPDGYTFGFFKAAWDIVGAYFISVVRYFFQSFVMLPAFNSTSLVLVPKSPNAYLARDFRTISCCSVVYKIITRILVDKLMYFFPAMISKSQSSFVRDRNIVDNTLLAQEIVKGYSRKSLSPKCAIKIDLQKAFDSGDRGIRQGDPLSPYLFVIAMNVLSSILDVAAKQRIFKFHPKCKRVALTNLCFADNLIVFCHGSLDFVLGVLCTLEKFYELSGLKLNAQKIEFFAWGLSSYVLDQICTVTGFRPGYLPVRYLGVPLVTRKLTGKECAALQLILPKGIIRDVERLCMRFFWKGSDTPARVTRFGRYQVCTLKSEGGLGLRNLVVWSSACCMLLVRNILAVEGSLWIAWIECKSHFSWILTKLLKLREEARGLFYPYANWNLINGKLPTKDRLARFGLVVDNACGLCGAGVESRDHLFTDCSFAMGVWGAMLNAYSLSFVARTWDEQLH